MPNYRRSNTSGATYFFTVVTHQRQRILCDDDIRLALHNAIQSVRETQPFRIDAWVLLPDHLHTIWTLPEGDSDFSKRWGRIKRLVSTQCGQHLPENGEQHAHNRYESDIWQKRFWEHQIRDDADFGRHMNYIHYNPVKHSLVSRAADWQYSTLHRYIQQGVYPSDWGCGDEFDGDFGEPMRF